MPLQKAIYLLKLMLNLKVKGKIVFNFDGGGKILPQFNLEGGSDLIEKLEKTYKA